MPFKKGDKRVKAVYADPVMKPLTAKNMNDDGVLRLCETILTDLRKEYELAYTMSKREPLGTMSKIGAERKLGEIKMYLKSPFVQNIFSCAGVSVEDMIYDIEGEGAKNDWQRLYGTDSASKTKNTTAKRANRKRHSSSVRSDCN